ncbi:MAG: DUF2330 domain-containing protein [Acidimicrobiales bacterium]
MRKTVTAIGTGLVATVLSAGPALACGGLIGKNGSVNLVRTTTLAAWHDGVEHYLTAFKFAGAGGEFGSIIPLPDVPTSVERGGDWTLQRLVREVTPQSVFARSASSATAGSAESAPVVLLETRIDALDITVLQGGGRAVGEWATKNGFLLTPDTPEVLDFYARRSPIFLAARFDADAARQKGVALGDGTPVHITIPTPNPWVPLRILGVGRQAAERINADVFLLTDKRPSLLPGEGAPGLFLDRREPATASLLGDLRRDKGMEWMPQSMWLTYLRVDALPAQLTYDLAVDATGAGQPSPEAAGLEVGQPAAVPVPQTDDDGRPVLPWALAGAAIGLVAAGGVLVAARRR